MMEFEYLGLYKTEPRYSLWDYGCPCLSWWDGTTSVVGELYKVDWYSKAWQDIYNMERNAGYKFEQVDLINFKYPTEPPYAFFQTPEDDCPRIWCGDWLVYKNGPSPKLI